MTHFQTVRMVLSNGKQAIYVGPPMVTQADVDFDVRLQEVNFSLPQPLDGAKALEIKSPPSTGVGLPPEPDQYRPRPKRKRRTTRKEASFRGALRALKSKTKTK